MDKYSLLVPLIAFTLSVPVFATSEYVPQKPTVETIQTTETNCNSSEYQPRKPVSNLDTSINSVQDFSPTLTGHPWYTFDHIGYKDSAFQGERHVAYFQEEGGVQFYGYDKEGLADVMLLKHPDNQSQTITLLQAPLRADWHTLDGNGVLFGVQPTAIPQAPGDYTTTSNETQLSFTGYAAVATQDEIQIRKYTNASISDLTENFEVLYSEPKECPSVDFVIEILGNKAKVSLGSRLLKEIELETTGRYTGIIVCYAEHNCESLSSVYTYSHKVNDIEYLSPAQ